MNKFDWAIVGAGPAGIAAVGKLLDLGINPQKIAWIDPQFTVGDFGAKWQQVPSNTKVSLFIQFLNACDSFSYKNCTKKFGLNKLDPEETCLLKWMAEPLQWITHHFLSRVAIFQNTVHEIQSEGDQWHLCLSGKNLLSKKVILAIGSEPKELQFPNIENIALEIALNPDKLLQKINPNDTVGVFGSSHSAILILRNLIESSEAKKIINFYRSPLLYAVYQKNEILFDDTGLKGTTAEWSKANLHENIPEKLERVFSSEKNLQQFLPECRKIISATGFSRREILVNGKTELHYNAQNGMIAPGLYGLGIAFPQAKINHLGEIEYRVGLWKFMDYLSSVLPEWSLTQEKSCLMA